MAPGELQKFSGIGPKTMDRLNKLGIVDLTTLLFHLPLRYEDRTKISSISNLSIGCHAAVVGIITESRVIKYGRAVLQCTLTNGSGSLQLSFFNFAKFRLQFKLKPGVRLYCYGEIRFTGRGIGMTHPEYKILASNEQPPVFDYLTAIYPTTDGLSQAVLRKLVAQGLALVSSKEKSLELLPRPLLVELRLANLVDALIFVHNLPPNPPPTMNPTLALDRNHPMLRRLIFEELLAEQISLLQVRLTIKKQQANNIHWRSRFSQEFLGKFPFNLTGAQTRVLGEIAEDLAKQEPMLRLLQGDVGCGKTIVAALAMGQTALNGYQTVLMAPTELLAKQHFKNISRWLSSFGIKVGLLIGNIVGKERSSTLHDINNGNIQITIGTHALFQAQVEFHNLALIVIDEQHRFGVHQRLQLRDKGYKNGYLPHQLIMTATPIPRTLAMTIYADLDYSMIDEMPPEHESVKTAVISNARRPEVIERVRNSCRAGKQVYWVCPLITESEHIQCQAAETLTQNLAGELPERRIALIHGRLSTEQKEQIMVDFLEHRVDLLVATTVIEVGIDVANANLMIIENAERLGLVQLHQLRGRVGRGGGSSYCLLLYQPPLLSLAKQRLLLMREQTDGFILAQKDLEIRGAGEVLGTKQSGTKQLKIADLFLDRELIPVAQKVGLLLLKEYPAAAHAIMARWMNNIEQYGQIG
jgi:ATP-dependent DNA helicase RecG